jgi:hypothetical protein
MPIDIIPTSQQLPAGFCPGPGTTWQQVLEQFNLATLVTIPDSLAVVISPTVPLEDQRNLLWVKMVNDRPQGIYVWSTATGAWEQIPGLPYYFPDESTFDNQVIINTQTGINQLPTINGRLFLVCIARTNLATINSGAVTFKVDATSPKPLRKQHDVELTAGELENGLLALISYYEAEDAYQVLTPLAKGTTVANDYMDYNPSGPSNLPTAANPVTIIPNTLIDSAGNHVRPQFLHVTLKCIDALGDIGYVLNDEIDAWALQGDDGTDQWTFYTICADATEIRVISTSDPPFFPPNIWPKIGGARSPLNAAKWVIRVRAFNPS